MNVDGLVAGKEGWPESLGTNEPNTNRILCNLSSSSMITTTRRDEKIQFILEIIIIILW